MCGTAGKGDAPAPSAQKKDIERDKAIDARLPDPPKLPQHLSAEDRKASRVDIEALYADSPIDSSLLSLYVHQNYTQYCNELDECGGIIDWLSWVDSSGGEHVSTSIASTVRVTTDPSSTVVFRQPSPFSPSQLGHFTFSSLSSHSEKSEAVQA